MRNKIIEVLIYTGFIIAIIGINHVKFGNSNATMSLYEGAKREIIFIKRKTESKKLANRIYKQIQYWQEQKEK